MDEDDDLCNFSIFPLFVSHNVMAVFLCYGTAGRPFMHSAVTIVECRRGLFVAGFSGCCAP